MNDRQIETLRAIHEAAGGSGNESREAMNGRLLRIRILARDELLEESGGVERSRERQIEPLSSFVRRGAVGSRWEELADLIEAMEAELARLRVVETAAREVLARFDGMEFYEARVVSDALADVRAALDEAAGVQPSGT